MAELYRLLEKLSAPEPNEHISRVASAPGFLTREECIKVIELTEELAEEQGGVYSANSNGCHKRLSRARDRYHVRKAKVKWMPPSMGNMWLYDKLEQAIQNLNKMYRFDLYGFEMLQVSTYADGGHFDWHIDMGGKNESTRKLSISVQLTDVTEYTGGDLEFIGNVGKIHKTVGSLIAFPSFLAHRVTPVVTGTRISLVGWIHGPALR